MLNVKPLFSYRPFWAKRFGTAPLLPTTRAEMDELGWDACDVILVTGDAYVDHPSFGMAVIGRVLEAQGFRFHQRRSELSRGRSGFLRNDGHALQADSGVQSSRDSLSPMGLLYRLSLRGSTAAKAANQAPLSRSALRPRGASSGTRPTRLRADRFWSWKSARKEAVVRRSAVEGMLGQPARARSSWNAGGMRRSETPH